MADYTNNPNNLNNPNNRNNNADSNNTLYFIVGGLVVLALIFGFIYMGNNDKMGDQNIEPAAGFETSTTTITTPDVNTPETPAMTETRTTGTDGVTDSATPVNERESTPGMPTSTGEQPAE